MMLNWAEKAIKTSIQLVKSLDSSLFYHPHNKVALFSNANLVRGEQCWRGKNK